MKEPFLSLIEMIFIVGPMGRGSADSVPTYHGATLVLC